jgi:hypothetical protein
MSANEGAGRSRNGRVWQWLTVVAIAGGAAMRLGALRTPFVADDFAQRAMLHGRYPVHRSPIDLYNFADGSTADTQALLDGGALPWWSHAHVKYAMLRPLSSALVWLDDALFGSSSFAAHAHSLLWWAFASSAVAWVLFSVLPARTAALGTLLFVLDEGHTWPVAWLANRNALVSLAFGALALGAYVRWREQRVPRHAAIASAAFALSCLGGEMGLCLGGYVIAYEIVVARGQGRHRAIGLLPALVPFAAYVVLYRALGRGAFGSDVYIDPTSEPAAFARVAIPRMLALMSDLLASTPAEQWNERGSLAPVSRVVVPAAVLIVGAFIGAVRRLDDRAAAHARWLLLGAPLAALPILASFVSARLLLPAEVGACAAFAVVIEGALRGARERGGRAIHILRRWLALAAGAAVIYVHGGLAARRSHLELQFWRTFYVGLEAAIAAAPVNPERLGESTVVLLTAADPHTLLYAPAVWQASGLPRPARWRVLSMAPGPHVVARIADDTLEVSPVSGEFLTTSLEGLFRSARSPMHSGEVVRLDGMTAAVRRLGTIGPRVVRFQFDRSLDAPTMTMLVAEGGELRRFRAPAVGSLVVIPPAAIPMRPPPKG